MNDLIMLSEFDQEANAQVGENMALNELRQISAGSGLVATSAAHASKAVNPKGPHGTLLKAKKS